ncbi:MAG: hypothetical protein V4539_06000 [Bacteroidota bacterium]
MSYIKSAFCVYILTGLIGFVSPVRAQGGDPLFYRERTIHLNNPGNKTIIEISLPDTLNRMSTNKKTLLIFYALPNGNSIDWTKGQRLKPEDDWHYDIQHIAAQTLYLRSIMTDWNVIVAYMANELKSWPAWKKAQPNGPMEIKRIVDSITGMFAPWHPEVMLNSHSGGGSFIFGYLDAVDEIPDNISRIGFIDSDYGYEDSLHTGKLVKWLKSSKRHHLNVLAYNDSVVIYNGKPLVSPTGGTWYRTKWMQRKLSESFSFKNISDTSLIYYSALSNRINIYLKTNDQGKIYHTEQVARNGFIHTVVSGTPYQKKAVYIYWGERVYDKYIRAVLH